MEAAPITAAEAISHVFYELLRSAQSFSASRNSNKNNNNNDNNDKD